MTARRRRHPLAKQRVDALAERISNGQYKSGDRLRASGDVKMTAAAPDMKRDAAAAERIVAIRSAGLNRHSSAALPQRTVSTFFPRMPTTEPQALKAVVSEGPPSFPLPPDEHRSIVSLASLIDVDTGRIATGEASIEDVGGICST